MTHKLIVTEHQGRLTYLLDRGMAEPQGHVDGFSNPLKPDELEDLRWYLEDYLVAPFAVWEERGHAIQAKLRDFGIQLFNALFGHGEIGRDAYLKVEDSASWELWLSSEDPAFLGLPWELLWDPQKPEPLALSLAGINRTLPQRQEALQVASGETLRILMVISRPSGLRDAGYRAVARPLFDKLNAVAGKVDIDLVRPPTFEMLRERLLTAKQAGRPYQVLHFDGHGKFGTTGAASSDPLKFDGEAKGYLIFEGATEQTREITADDFGSLIDEADVPLVVLNACRSGTLGTAVGPEATVATRLMQSGTAAVVAMGFSVYVRAAAEFMAAFYESLFQGENVTHAVARGRQQLRRFNLRPSPKGDLPLQDWCVPVHYGRREVAFANLKVETATRPAGLSLEGALEILRDREQQAATEQAEDQLAPVGRFIGRDRAFYMLEQALGQAPVTLLSGVGGTGKTELAKAFARWLRRTGWAEGVFFHSFEPGVATFGLDGLVAAAGIALLGPNFIGSTESKEQRRALLLQVLKQHRIVLVLDNFETVRSMPDRTGATPPLDDTAADDLRAFLAKIHDEVQSLVLITSRGDEAWLGDINRLTIGGLDTAEVHEFADNLLAGKPDAQQRRHAKAFGELLTMLHGHPLSLRLLLPQLEHRDAKVLIAGLQGQKPWSARESRDPGRLDSLDASVAYSLDQLDAQDRSRLVALSQFEGVVDAGVLATFSKQEQVPERFDDMSRDDWAALLDRVTGLGLLSTLGSGCYRLHPALPGYLLRDWRDQAKDAFAEEQEKAELALIHATADFGRWLRSQLETGRAELAMALIDLQRRSLGRVLGETLARELYLPAQGIMQPLNDYWDARGLAVEADGWVDRIRLAIEDDGRAIPDFEDEAGGLWLFAVGSQANRLQLAGRLDGAEAIHREIAGILERSKASSARRHLAVAYHQLGMVAQDRGAHDLAEDWYKKSLAIEEELGSRPGMAMSYHQLGIVALDRGAHDLAEDWYKRSLAIKEEQGNRPGMATSYHQLGRVAEERGAYDLAEDWYEKSLAIKEELGNRPGMAMSYHQLGIVAYLRDAYDLAEDWCKKSLAIFEELSSRPRMATSYHQLGMVAQKRGASDLAEDWYKKSLVIDEELGNRPGMASSYHQLGIVAQDRGSYDLAEERYKKSLAIREELSNRPSMATSYHQLGMVAQERGAYGVAEDWYKKSLAIFEELGNRSGMAKSYHQLGTVVQKRGAYDLAADWWKKAAEAGHGGALGKLAVFTLLGLGASIGAERLSAATHDAAARLPSQWTEGWSDSPPIPLAWQDVALDGAGALVAKLDLAAGDTEKMPFSARHTFTRIRTAALPFYDALDLVDIQVGSSSSGEDCKIASALVSTHGALLLDGTSGPIHLLNEHGIHLDGDAAIEAYLRFFMTFVRGDAGPFHIVSDLKDLTLVADVNPDDRGAIESKISPLKRLRSRESAEDGAFYFEATVNYANALFKSTMKMLPSGMVEMLEESCVATDLPIQQRSYQDTFRTAPAAPPKQDAA